MNSNNLTKFKICFLFVVTFITFSCKNEIKVVLTDAVSEKIEQDNHKYLITVYLEGIGCTSCALQNLRPWAKHKQVLDKYNTGILLVINYLDEHAIIEKLKSIGIFDAFVIVFDKDGEFRMLNNDIFHTVQDGIFVFDESKNVIFTESPIKSEEKWNAFVKIIKNKNF
jgi:hypothetical protein